MTSRRSLAQILARAGLATAELADAQGGKILLLKKGARVLGLFAPGDDRNFLWTNPALHSAAAARNFFAAEGWLNPGGDRTWLAPEHALFFSDGEPSWKTYRVPAALDPGNFTLRQLRASARFEGRARLSIRESEVQATVRISKTIAPAVNPLSESASFADLAFAGYTTSTGLTAKSPSPVALWQLLQLPHGGTMLVAIHGKTQARALFGDINRRNWSAARGLFRHTMKAAGNHKIGLPAGNCTGRAGYLYAAGRREWSLVIRQWTVKPDGRYLDAPWQKPDGPGDCFQLCNVNSAIGRFSELEYHAPVAIAEDRSEVWAFRGSRRTIAEVARILLGARDSIFES